MSSINYKYIYIQTINFILININVQKLFLLLSINNDDDNNKL